MLRTSAASIHNSRPVPFRRIPRRRPARRSGDLTLVDTDPAFGQNYGIVDGRVIAVDIGRLQQARRSFVLQEELRNSIYHFRKWLRSRYPELVSTLDDAVWDHS